MASTPSGLSRPMPARNMVLSTGAPNRLDSKIRCDNGRPVKL